MLTEDAGIGLRKLLLPIWDRPSNYPRCLVDLTLDRAFSFRIFAQ